MTDINMSQESSKSWDETYKTLIGNLHFSKCSRQKAAKHEWLYHCTTSTALINIFTTKEIWLTNLKYVNDKEEIDRISVPEYEDKFFVACFTEKSDISPEHWKEYSQESNGVLWAVKQTFFTREVYLLDDNNTHMQGENYRVIKGMEMESSQSSSYNPYNVYDIDFYQVCYNDNLKKQITLNFPQNDPHKQFVFYDVAGIIKSEKGLCRRDGNQEYEKNWKEEKEVRLKTCIMKTFQEECSIANNKKFDNKLIIKKVAVPFSDEACENINIRLSPYFKDKNAFVDQLREVFKECDYEIVFFDDLGKEITDICRTTYVAVRKKSNLCKLTPLDIGRIWKPC